MKNTLTNSEADIVAIARQQVLLDRIQVRLYNSRLFKAFISRLRHGKLKGYMRNKKKKNKK